MGYYGWDPPDEYPDPEPRCPVCGKVPEKIYKDADGYVVGCDNCLTAFNPEDVDECFEDPLEPPDEPDPDEAYERRREMEYEWNHPES